MGRINGRQIAEGGQWICSPPPRRRRPLVFYGMVGCCSRLHEPPPYLSLDSTPPYFVPTTTTKIIPSLVFSPVYLPAISFFRISTFKKRDREDAFVCTRREKLGSMNAELVFELQWRKGIYWRCKIQRLDQRRSACSVQTFTIRIMPLLGIERGVGISDLASMQC